MAWLAVVALLLLLLGWASMRRAGRLREESGLPVGRLIYADGFQTDWHPPAEPLYSARYRLVGKPDYLVRTGGKIIPVEVKSATAPEIPYLGHVLQLAAYCLLVEETSGQTPPHGLLKYTDALYEIDFTAELRAELLDTLADMRRARLARNVARNHGQPNKCARCGFRHGCDEAL
jgi:CRISPR-associated exonuclease Cas4